MRRALATFNRELANNTTDKRVWVPPEIKEEVETKVKELQRQTQRTNDNFKPIFFLLKCLQKSASLIDSLSYTNPENITLYALSYLVFCVDMCQRFKNRDTSQPAPVAIVLEKDTSDARKQVAITATDAVENYVDCTLRPEVQPGSRPPRHCRSKNAGHATVEEVCAEEIEALRKSMKELTDSSSRNLHRRILAIKEAMKEKLEKKLSSKKKTVEGSHQEVYFKVCTIIIYAVCTHFFGDGGAGAAPINVTAYMMAIAQNMKTAWHLYGYVTSVKDVKRNIALALMKDEKVRQVVQYIRDNLPPDTHPRIKEILTSFLGVPDPSG